MQNNYEEEIERIRQTKKYNEVKKVIEEITQLTKNSIITRFDAISILIGYYKVINEEIWQIVNVLYIDKILNK